MFRLLSLAILLTNFIAFASSQEVYVLFRGFHFTRGQPIPTHAQEPIPQDCKSWYMETSGFDAASATRKAKRLQRLKESGPVAGEREQVYPSRYDWIQQLFVSDCTKFKADLENLDSHLRISLNEICQLACDQSFLISTSLSSQVALKFAAGLCTPSGPQRDAVLGDDGVMRIPDALLGYIDVFVIPANQISLVHPYFVLEEFARHRIKIPTHFMQNYTLQEEVNFPFLIPSRYHKARLSLNAAQFPRSDTRWGRADWIKYHLIEKKKDPLTSVIEGLVGEYLRNNNKTRTYLGPLRRSLQRVLSYRLTPPDAVAFRNSVEGWILDIRQHSFRSPDNYVNTAAFVYPDGEYPRFLITLSHLDVHRAWALNTLGHLGCYNIFVGLKMNLGLPGAGTLLPILVQAPYINYILVRGPHSDGLYDQIRYKCDNIDEALEEGLSLEELENYFVGDFPHWTRPDITELEEALKHRERPLVFNVTGQGLAPEIYNRLTAANPVTVDIFDEHEDENNEYGLVWWPERCKEVAEKRLLQEHTAAFAPSEDPSARPT